MKANVRLLSLVCFAVLPSLAIAQDFDSVQIETVPVADGVFMLMGQGGNIGLSVGSDGAFIVDDQFAPLTDKILAAIAEQTDASVEFVVNTHWHFDHTGGNENFGGAGALIVAHENVRQRMNSDQFIEALDMRTTPSPAAALPVVTFTSDVTFHWNGEDIHVFHVADGHTDGDAMIHFMSANVIHAGDNYFNGRYPFVDVSSGGSMHGMIENVEAMLAIADGDTRIIPGHGPLSNEAELTTYRDLLATVRDRIQALIDGGADRDATIAAKPTADFDDAWGNGFINPDMWVGILWDSLSSDSH